MYFFIDKIRQFIQQEKYQACEILRKYGTEYYYLVEIKNMAKVNDGYSYVMTDESMFFDFLEYVMANLRRDLFEMDTCIIRYYHCSGSPYTVFHPLHYKITILTQEEYERRLKRNRNKYFFIRKDLKW